jgi:leucyl-tRNA synthetase
VARTKRLQGFNVLHPFGWDAFGLPAENAAIKEGIHPEVSTLSNIAHMKGQLQRLGISYAWERELATCLPDYYHWNQWLFTRMFDRGLAYRRRSTVNWCPSCQTVLANEQVVDGGCWRCGTPVTLKDLEQWFFRITAYADDLLAGAEELSKWPDKVLTMQRNWIGRSEGARITFPLGQESGTEGWTEGGILVPPVREGIPPATRVGIEVFTTRIDTIYGATFVLLAPEHPLVASLADASDDPVRFRQHVARFRAQDRAGRVSGEVDKEGFSTGRYAINPFTNEPVPVWVANFILGEYGTGAVMAVPAHDQRDFEFARKYGLPIRVVVRAVDGDVPAVEQMTEAVSNDGVLINSNGYDGVPSEDARRRLTAEARKRGLGEGTVQYRLKDWGISR